jgi:hypothetical protein
VQVRVFIREEFVVKRLEVSRVHAVNLEEGISYSVPPVTVSVLIRFPRRLSGTVGELHLAADCSGIDRPGVYQVPLQLSRKQPEMELVKLEPDEISVTIIRRTSSPALPFASPRHS